jgi:prepilin-type N-terminal cleavage/methylation domain-containing protein
MKLLNKKEKGFSLIEILIATAIFVLIMITLSYFLGNVFQFNNTIQSSLGIQQQAQKIIRPFAEEVRSASISNIGAFPISKAQIDLIEFYSDIDSDGLKEKIRYFKSDGQFKKGIIKPTGNPAEYRSEDEEIVGIISGVQNGELPIFQYYNSSYNGTASTTALDYPINVKDVTLVKVTLYLDEDLNNPPGAIEISTQAMFRNLKDN